MARLADGTHFLKILDFGLAKRVDPFAPEQTLGRMAGTPLYMAPEQTRGQPTGPFTDLYAVGCIAFELCAGRPPFSSANLVELLQLQQSAPPPPLPPEVPAALGELIFSLLEKDPARRPASALVARQALERVERRLIAASGTNAALPAQRAVEPAPPSGARPIRARSVPSEPVVEKERPPSEPRRRPASRRAPSLPEADLDGRPTSAGAAEPDETRIVRETSTDVRPTVSARATSLEARPTAIGVESRPTALLSPAAGKASRAWFLLGLLPLLLVGWLLFPVTAPEPVVAPRAPVRLEEKREIPAAAPPVVEEVVPPPVEPQKTSPPEEPRVARVRPTAPPEPRAPRANTNVRARVSALEQRCQLELVESQQRLALRDLKDLVDELSGMSTEEAMRQLNAFETQWLKGAHR
jgi:serine/threonine-protein kinase